MFEWAPYSDWSKSKSCKHFAMRIVVNTLTGKAIVVLEAEPSDSIWECKDQNSRQGRNTTKTTRTHLRRQTTFSGKYAVFEVWFSLTLAKHN